MNLRIMTEAELRDCDVPWPKTEDELLEIIRALAERAQDYGTCVYAMSIAATATFYYMSHVVGSTGFQASCADLDVLRRTRWYKHGFSITDYSNLLYPQYFTDEHFPTKEMLLEKNRGWLRDEAKKKLAQNGGAHSEVSAWWEKLANG